MDQNTMEDNDKEFQPNLILKNDGKIGHFRRFGLFLVSWNKRKYEASQKKLLFYYILWYMIEIGCFALA